MISMLNFTHFEMLKVVNVKKCLVYLCNKILNILWEHLKFETIVINLKY